jgi:hypothetical protein
MCNMIHCEKITFRRERESIKTSLRLPKMQTRSQVMATLSVLASSGRLTNSGLSARGLVERIANGSSARARIPVPEDMTITELFQSTAFMSSFGECRCLPMGIALYLQQLKDICARAAPCGAARFRYTSDGSLLVYVEGDDAVWIDDQQNKYFTYDEREDARMQQQDGLDTEYDYDVYYRYRCRKGRNVTS